MNAITFTVLQCFMFVGVVFKQGVFVLLQGRPGLNGAKGPKGDSGAGSGYPVRNPEP